MTHRRLIAHFGSLRTTLALMALLGVVAFARPSMAPLGLALTLLAVNLGAAIVVHPAFRRQLPLLMAHLALLLLVVGAGIGRLVALDGHFELTQGVPFDGRLIQASGGPLHRERLQQLAFMHEGFEIDYAPGRRRGATRNPVVWRDGEGQSRRAVIGDHRPLVLQGHRIYTSPNKGFAPLLRWEPDQGDVQRGAVHLPSYPVHELRQSREWALPDGRAIWIMLRTDETLIDAREAASFRLPQRHHLVVRLGDERFELAPGRDLRLPGGRLVYEELRTWMGYRIAYDPTLPWLLAAALLASLCLCVHYALKFGAGLPTNHAQAGGPPIALASELRDG